MARIRVPLAPLAVLCAAYMWGDPDEISVDVDSEGDWQQQGWEWDETPVRSSEDHVTLQEARPVRGDPRGRAQDQRGSIDARGGLALEEPDARRRDELLPRQAGVSHAVHAPDRAAALHPVRTGLLEASGPPEGEAKKFPDGSRVFVAETKAVQEANIAVDATDDKGHGWIPATVIQHMQGENGESRYKVQFDEPPKEHFQAGPAKTYDAHDVVFELDEKMLRPVTEEAREALKKKKRGEDSIRNSGSGSAYDERRGRYGLDSVFAAEEERDRMKKAISELAHAEGEHRDEGNDLPDEYCGRFDDPSDQKPLVPIDVSVFGLDSLKKKKLGFTDTIKAFFSSEVYVPEPNYCPKACPYVASIAKMDEDDTDGRQAQCKFVCVTGKQCREPEKFNLKTGAKPGANLYPGKKTMTCDTCRVFACDVCEKTPESEWNDDKEWKDIDRCKECSSGFDLDEETGKCKSKSLWKWILFFSIMGFLGLVFVGYFVDICFFRKTVNQEELDKAQAFRRAAKFHDTSTVKVKRAIQPSPRPGAEEAEGDAPEPHDDVEVVKKRGLMPIWTNVHNVCFGGPALILSFDYQRAVLVWAVFVSIFWFFMTFHVRSDAQQMATSYGDEKRACQVKAEIKDRVSIVEHNKAHVLWLIYVGSTLYWLVFSFIQQRTYHNIKHQEVEVEDYCCTVKGILKPDGTAFDGSENAEEAIADEVERICGFRPIGVSVAWDIKDYNRLWYIVMKELDAAEGQEPAGFDDNGYNKIYDNYAIGSLFCGCGRWTDRLLTYILTGAPGRKPDDDAEAFCRGMQATDKVFVVFDSVIKRHKAMPLLTQAGFLVKVGKSPATILWQNAAVTKLQQYWNLFKGSVWLLGGMCIWAATFYAPYAIFISSVMSTDRDSQKVDSPPVAQTLLLGLIITLGNQLIYLLCFVISDRMGFMYNDDREVCYTTMYTIACLLNTVIDVGLQCVQAAGVFHKNQTLAHDILSADTGQDKNVRETSVSHNGALMADPVFHFSVAKHLYEYSWPSCFLLSYICEPIFLVGMFYVLGKHLVRTQPHVKGINADLCLIPQPMDLSRYGDILVNVFLCVMTTIVSTVHVSPIFLMMFLSHLYIYFYDRYRVFRLVPAFEFKAARMEHVTQVFMAWLCGILAFALGWTSQMQYIRSDEGLQENAELNVWFPLLYMVLHFIVHTLIIAWAIPAVLQRIKVMPREDREKLLGVRKELKDVPYARTARKTPANYFTTNWVHCLRSKYIHKHSPPVRPYFAGKETILERNVQAGVYFSGRGIVERKSIAAGFRQDLKACLPLGVAGAIDKYGKKKGDEPAGDAAEVTLPDSDADSMDGEGEALPDSDDSFDLLAGDNHAFDHQGTRLR